jgi:hypothetical protein
MYSRGLGPSAIARPIVGIRSIRAQIAGAARAAASRKAKLFRNRMEPLPSGAVRGSRDGARDRGFRVIFKRFWKLSVGRLTVRGRKAAYRLGFAAAAPPSSLSLAR